MLQENVKLYRRGNAAWNSGDLDQWLATVTSPDWSGGPAERFLL